MHLFCDSTITFEILNKNDKLINPHLDGGLLGFWCVLWRKILKDMIACMKTHFDIFSYDENVDKIICFDIQYCCGLVRNCLRFHDRKW